ncbi:MAG TPA: bifunctional hydroxymethylpyrimidine kinase/phosphomethylpyrimidine kinase [Candidatus Eisenbacteria bacterium]|nr:bifunctional hydroxymethylpyrimidine kinase/phosphomethylpyrimidine kinase [Candidatus Eisenbacteria bacterium]
MDSRPIILSIAGYDPSSGAGITADVKTAAALGCYAVTCMTALTVQSTQGVFAVEPVRPDVIRETLSRLAVDVELAGVRIGMLGSGEVAEVVADFLGHISARNVVLDPVLRSSSGAALIDELGIEVIRGQLLRLANVVTPNIDEAAVLAGEPITKVPGSWPETLACVEHLSEKLHSLGSRGVVITGGHLPEANDFLSLRAHGQVFERMYLGGRIKSRATHGTGCAFATALCCQLALGRDVPEAVGEAKEFVRRAMLAAYPVGKGTGPMNHLFALES